MASEIPLSTNPDATNLPVLSVGELSGALKRTIEQAFSYVRVRGEISGCKRHSSGHVYLALKDADAVMDAVIWRGVAQRVTVQPEDGMEVICTGKLTTFPGRSKYQLVIEQMELAGEGALLKLLEDRKRKLAAEGLFAESRKRKLPYLPEVIGVITSPTGAVIRDILHRLSDRFPRHVLLWPVAVQGEGAAAQVARAIAGFNALPLGGAVPRPDLLIVARGGGSLEDLMAFNEEIVVRAVASSEIPLISAVGHETDTTLIDFAADRRAPTPTAAAEISVPVRAELLTGIRTLGNRLDSAALRVVADRGLRVEGLGRGLPDPESIIQAAEQKLDDRVERLDLAKTNYVAGIARDLQQLDQRLALRTPHQQIIDASLSLDQIAARLSPTLDRTLERTAERIVNNGKMLESLSPYRVLERGYAVVQNTDGHLVGADDITPGMPLRLRFADDRSVAAHADGDEAAVPAKPRKRTAASSQPTLF